MPLSFSNKTILITGAAKRVGAATAELFHQQGANIVITYRSSKEEALAFQQKMESKRQNSVAIIQVDLANTEQFIPLIAFIIERFGQLDVLINNASSFYPTPMGSVTEDDWNDLISSNLKGPFFLAQAATEALKKTQGAIINIVDIHADRPLLKHPVYCIAKAGLAMMTKSLARELGPDIRVNGISPGPILWPDEGIEQKTQDIILSRTALKRMGTPSDIASMALFLAQQANYITGQIIAVDGGRSIVL